MIAHELLFLGLLNERPKHGYEIKKEIKGILSVFAGIEATSVYYPLTILEKKGYIQSKALRQGVRPRKFIYHVTAKGHDRFLHLLSRSFLDITRPYFTLDLSLYFLARMDISVARCRLRARMRVLEKLIRRLRTMQATVSNASSHPLGLILEHNLQMVMTEKQFLLNLLKTM
jgi:DNA-binding PadR family transcriptional regulator